MIQNKIASISVATFTSAVGFKANNNFKMIIFILLHWTRNHATLWCYLSWSNNCLNFCYAVGKLIIYFLPLHHSNILTLILSMRTKDYWWIIQDDFFLFEMLLFISFAFKTIWQFEDLLIRIISKSSNLVTSFCILFVACDQPVADKVAQSCGAVVDVSENKYLALQFTVGLGSATSHTEEKYVYWVAYVQVNGDRAEQKYPKSKWHFYS